jgi:hypothetical protein
MRNHSRIMMRYVHDKHLSLKHWPDRINPVAQCLQGYLSVCIVRQPHGLHATQVLLACVCTAVIIIIIIWDSRDSKIVMNPVKLGIKNG